MTKAWRKTNISKIVLLIATFAMLAMVSTSVAQDTPTPTTSQTKIGTLTWNEANIEQLRSLSQDDIAEFLTSIGQTWNLEDSVKAEDIQDYAWSDFAGNGEYRLVVVLQQFGTAPENFVSVYNKSPVGGITAQSFEASATIDPLNRGAIQDLNGDGKKELIIPDSPYDRKGDGEVAIWPEVYRLENGTFVEASADFPKFYDKQVLPKLNSEIEEANVKLGLVPPPPATRKVDRRTAFQCC